MAIIPPCHGEDASSILVTCSKRNFAGVSYHISFFIITIIKGENDD